MAEAEKAPDPDASSARKDPPVAEENADTSKADPPADDAASKVIDVDMEDTDDATATSKDKETNEGDEKKPSGSSSDKKKEDGGDASQTKEEGNIKASDVAAASSSPPEDPPSATDKAALTNTENETKEVATVTSSTGDTKDKPEEEETSKADASKSDEVAVTDDPNPEASQEDEKEKVVVTEPTAANGDTNKSGDQDAVMKDVDDSSKEEADPTVNGVTTATLDDDQAKNEETKEATGETSSSLTEASTKDNATAETASAPQPMEVDNSDNNAVREEAATKNQSKALEEEAKKQKEAEAKAAAEEEGKKKREAEEEAKKQKEAADEETRKIKEAAAAEEARKQKEIADALERKRKEEEELERKRKEAAEAARKRREELLKQWPKEKNEEDRYDFPDYDTLTKKKKKKKAKGTSKKVVKISIRSVSPETAAATTPTTPGTGDPMEVDMAATPVSPTSKPDDNKLSTGAVVVDVMPNLTEFTSLGDSFPFSSINDASAKEKFDEELEDSLFFFQETHEEQDPAYISYIKEREEQAVKKRLSSLQEEDAIGRKEIDKAISVQSKEKQTLTNKNIEKYKLKAGAEEKRDVQRLMQMYKDKMASNQGRIDQGIKILTQRHGQEMQKAVQQHRQHFQNQTQSPQAQQRWASVAQQLQAKQQRQMQEFRSKGEEMKKKSKKDFETQQEKLRNQYQKKLHEIEQSRRKVYAKIFNGFQQLRQRYLKRHMQRILKRKEQILEQSELAKKNAQREMQQGLSEIASGDTAPTTPAKKNADAAKTKDEKEELRPPSPIKSLPEWVQDELMQRSNGAVTGASARHKQRKSVLSQVGKQLSVEIHNEGLWISVFVDKNKDGDTEDSSNRSNTTRGNDKGSKSKDDKKGDGKDVDKSQETFIPWGVEAHVVLQSIVCGEIPRGYRFAENGAIDYGDALSVQGGHVRCVVTDLRTSYQTASSQRAASVKEQEDSNLHGLEQKIVELSSLANESEAALNRAGGEEKDCRTTLEKAIQEVEKAKKIQQEFRTKFSGYLGADGNPLPTANPNDRTELAKAIMRYKSNLDSAGSKYRAAKSAATEARARTTKMKDVAKHAQKAVAVATALLKKKKALIEPPKKGRGGRLTEAAEAEKAAVRVKDVIASFHKTAEKRRDQLNQKRNSSASSTWVQSLPGLPGPLKKSLWHKMHRRRQQIVLRPSLESLTSDLREDLTRTLKRVYAGKKNVNIENELLKAEQTFYLAMHPESPKDAPPSVPPSSGLSSESWAEPGWQLNLDVPKTDRMGQILPCAPSFPVFSKNHAELCSAPGRQAAAFSRPSHLRCLASNLSAVATATSLAETNPSVSSEVTLAEGDPLNISEDVWTVGYSFHLHPPAKPTAGQKRKSSGTTMKENAEKAAAEVKRQEAAAAKASESSSASQKPQPKKRRTSKGAATGGSPSTARKAKPAAKRGSATQQQQPAAIARAPSASPAYGRQPTPPAAAAAAAQYGQYMKHSSPPQAPQQQQQQQQQQNYQLMQQQQQQQSRPQPGAHQGQYGSPQQRQMAQLRMMQQQQQQTSQQRGQPMAAGYPQTSQRGGPAPAVPPQPFFNPMAPAPGQPYQAPQHMQMPGMPGMQPMGQPMHMGQQQQQPPPQQQQQQQRRNSQQGVDDSQSDPLFMLK